MRFIIMMIPGVDSRPSDPDFKPPAGAIDKMTKYNEALAKAGVLLGSFTGAKEAVGGYWLIQTQSKEEAVEWARRVPAEKDDVIEVRQVSDMADFGPGLQSTPETRAVEAAIAKK